jgi:hypothetical protein
METPLKRRYREIQKQHVREHVVDARPLSERETRLVEQLRRLALEISENDTSSLRKYFEIGGIVYESNESANQLAHRINLRGFGHATLSDSVLFRNYVVKNHRRDVDAFITAMEADPNYAESVSWRNARQYIRRDRVAVSQGERDADREYDLKIAIEPFKDLAERSRQLLAEWEKLPQDARVYARPHLKRSHHNIDRILGLEPLE